MSQLMDLMTALDAGTNFFGPLDSTIRARLFAVADDPNEQTWEDAHSILISSFTTLWQAVMKHTDYRVNSKPMDGPWPQIPTAAQILTALHTELKG